MSEKSLKRQTSTTFYFVSEFSETEFSNIGLDFFRMVDSYEKASRKH